jgi:hypothetical protein
MSRRLRADVPERENVIGLVNDVGGDFAFDYFQKKII